MNAKLRIKAETSKTNPKGRIWSAGTHHVFVDNKPARVHVPQYTVLDTFNKLTDKLKSDGTVKFGVDHLPDTLYEDNKILAKMNLNDVGDITKVVYDGESIYIQDSTLTNTEIQRLHETGELPAYSIVGAMEASPCPNERADYVVDNIVIDRVDFVESGGCQECKTGVEPGQILITSKKSKPDKNDDVEADTMADKQDEQVKDESVEGNPAKEEAPKDEEREDNKEQKESDDAVDKASPEEEEKQEDKPKEDKDEDESDDLVKELKNEIKDLREMIEGKKPNIKAKTSEEHNNIVEQLIQAGKATPSQKESLLQLAASNSEAFHEYSKQLEPTIDFTIKSKFAQMEKKQKQEEELTVEEAWKRLGRD